METSKFKIVTAVSAYTVAIALLTAAQPVIPAHALINTSEGLGASDKAIVELVASTEESKPVAMLEIDYSKESSASLRMKPLKEKLASFTQADIDIEAAKFSDMLIHWGKPQVSKLSKLEITKGYTDRTFKPENSVTVAEFTTMAIKALGYKLEQNPKYWAQNFIDQAIKDGLFKKGDFDNYNRPITREEVAKLSVNACMLYDTAPKHDMDKVVIKRLKDYSTVKDSLKQKVIDANLLGLMSTYGSSGKFMPKNNLTRAESATLIVRLLDNATRAKFVPLKTEMITGYNEWNQSTYVLVNDNKPEVLPMAYKILEATKKTKGYVSIEGSEQTKVLGIDLFDNKAHQAADSMGQDLDIMIEFAGEPAGHTDHPYTMVIRNAANTKALHMDFIKELISMFYGDDSDKVLAQFNKCLDSAIKLDDKAYETWTYRTGIKFNGRGIYLATGAYDPEIAMWFYSK